MVATIPESDIVLSRRSIWAAGSSVRAVDWPRKTFFSCAICAVASAPCPATSPMTTASEFRPRRRRTSPRPTGS